MRLKNLMALILAALLASACASAFENARKEQDYKERLAKAEVMFQERCKKAGVFVHRTAENVEGVFLLKLRPEDFNYRDQYKMDDPYGSDSFGEYYIRSFFLGLKLFANRYQSPEVLESIRRDHRGYRYVDAVDPKDGTRYRYTGRIDQPWLRDKRYGEWVREFVLDKVSAPDPAPRYGVTYDDISTREERDYWIAGSSLRVIDLKTGEVMAERIGYMMDRGQGDQSGGRAPWFSAADNACPRFGPEKTDVPRFVSQDGQTRKFVTKVIQPSLEK